MGKSKKSPQPKKPSTKVDSRGNKKPKEYKGRGWGK